MQRLIIMRHATAAGRGGGTDRARPLTAVGRNEARSVGLRLRELGFEPDRILSSPATRCVETWDAVREELGSDLFADFDDTLYNASATELMQALAGSEDAGTLLLLAHNPGVSMLAFELGRDRPDDETHLRAGFAPATFAVFEIGMDREADDDGLPRPRRVARLIHMERPDAGEPGQRS